MTLNMLGSVVGALLVTAFILAWWTAGMEIRIRRLERIYDAVNRHLQEPVE